MARIHSIRDWTDKLKPYKARAPHGILMWMLTPAGGLCSVRIRQNCLRELLKDSFWHDEKVESSQVMYSLTDFNHRIMTTTGRYIYMAYCTTGSKLTYNPYAVAILGDLMILDVPPPPYESPKEMFESLPRGPVFFIQESRHKNCLVDYTLGQFRTDWPNFFRTGAPWQVLMDQKDFDTRRLLPILNTKYNDPHFRKWASNKLLREVTKNSVGQYDRILQTFTVAFAVAQMGGVRTEFPRIVDLPV